jgi:hypothetical protein
LYREVVASLRRLGRLMSVLERLRANRRLHRVGRVLGTVSVAGALGGQILCGGLFTVFGAQYLAQSVAGVLVVEDCGGDMAQTVCWGLFTSDDGTVREHWVRAVVDEPGVERLSGWIEGPAGEELHTEEPWGALGVGTAFLLWALAPLLWIVVRRLFTRPEPVLWPRRTCRSASHRQYPLPGTSRQRSQPTG